MEHRSGAWGLAAALLLVLAACGSTVDPSSVAAARRAGGDALAPGSSDAGASASATTVLGTGTDQIQPGAVPGTGSGAGGSGGQTVGPSGGGSSSAAGGPVAKGKPVEIGFVRTGVSNAAAFGVSSGSTVTESQLLDALVKSYNAHGGIGGHQIVPVYADTDTASSSWDADFAAACAQFTEDHHVVAVLGYAFTYLEAFEACLAKKGVPHLSTSFNVPDAPTVAQFPLWFPISTPLIERRSVEKIDGGLATGILTSKSKIGIVLDSCPGTQEAWKRTTEPYLKAKKLDVASTFDFGCPSGQGDAGAEAGRVGGLVLQFRSDGVDTVMIMGTSEGPPVFLLANAAESQGYRPQYIVSSLANASVLGGQMPASQARNIHGFGWLPNQDVSPADFPPLTASAQRCVKMLRDQGIELKAAVDWANALSQCDSLFLYERALTTTRGDVGGPGVAAAIESLGDTYESAMVLAGHVHFGRGRHDGPSSARAFDWVDDCSCFRYGKTVVPIG